MRRPFAAAIKHAIDIDVHDLLPCIDGVIPNLCVGARNARAVDHAIDGTVFQSGFGSGYNRCMLGHIDFDRVNLARMVQAGCRFGHASFIAVPQGDAAAGSQHAFGNGVTQTGSTAGNDRMAAFHVILIHGILSLVRIKSE